MAKNDRILSQSEIDSLLKKIMPNQEEPVSTEKPESVEWAESSESETPLKASADTQVERLQPSVLKEETPVNPATSSNEQTVPSEPKKATQPSPTSTSGKLTDLSKTEEKESPQTLRPVESEKPVVVSDDIGSLKQNIAELSKEVTKLTVAVQAITQLEERVKNLEANLKLLPDSDGALKSRIDRISSVIQVLQQNKSASDFFQEFVCSQCRSQGLVAIHVKCTSCGKENWMGWWPDENNK